MPDRIAPVHPVWIGPKLYCARGREHAGQLGAAMPKATSNLRLLGGTLLSEFHKKGWLADPVYVVGALPYERYSDDPVGFVRDVLKEDCYWQLADVMVSVRDHRITVARSSNSTGKTWLMARLAVWWLLCHRGSQVWTYAAPPEENLDRVWGELGKIVRKHPQLFMGYSIGSRRIERVPNSEGIWASTIPVAADPHERQARAAGKHAPWLLFLVDEGDAVPEPLYTGIEQCMTGGVARLCISFNPRDQTGPVWDMERLHTANVVGLCAFEHPNVVSGLISVPGAVDREITLKRIHEWTESCEANDEGDTFEVPECLVGCTLPGNGGMLLAGIRRVIDGRFPYMVLGRYPVAGQGDAYYDRSFLVARQREEALRCPTNVSGVWVAASRDHGQYKVYDLAREFPGWGGILTVFKEPEEDAPYGAGVDVAWGILADNSHDGSTIDIANLSTWEHVASYNGQIEPDPFAEVVDWLCKQYGPGLPAMVCVERNTGGGGTTVLNRLRKLAYPRIWYENEGKADHDEEDTNRQAGWQADVQSKPLRDDNTQAMIREWRMGYESCILHGNGPLEQLIRYCRLPGGRAGGRGAHDDHNSSIGLMLWLCKEHGRPRGYQAPTPPSRSLGQRRLGLEPKGDGSRVDLMGEWERKHQCPVGRDLL